MNIFLQTVFSLIIDFLRFYQHGSFTHMALVLLQGKERGIRSGTSGSQTIYSSDFIGSGSVVLQGACPNLHSYQQLLHLAENLCLRIY